MKIRSLKNVSSFSFQEGKAWELFINYANIVALNLAVCLGFIS